MRLAARVAMIVASLAFATTVRADDSHRPFGNPRVRLEWPDAVGLHLDGGYGSTDLSRATFENASASVPGSSMRVGRFDVAGAELGLELTISRHFRVGGGLGFYGPVGGAAGGDLAARFGREASVSGLYVFTGFAEALFVHAFGDLTAFGGLRVAFVHSELGVDAGCVCDDRFFSLRPTFGPRVGLRTKVYRSVFLQAALFADTLNLPDYVATLGVGFGRQAL